MSYGLASQQPTGAMSDLAGRASYYHTACFIRGVLHAEASWPELYEAAQKACAWLSRTHEQFPQQSAVDRWAPVTIRWVAKAALHAAGQRWQHTAWSRPAQREFGMLHRAASNLAWDVPLPFYAKTIEAWLDLGFDDRAIEALRLPAARQRRCGSVVALPNERWISGEGLARLAMLWYRLGDRERGDRAIRCLAQRQHPDGSFPASWGSGSHEPGRVSLATTAAFLLASRRQVAVSFADEQTTLPSELEQGDGRWDAMEGFARWFSAGARVADLGCGPGRFLRRLAEQFPELRWVGIDASARWLDALPATIERRQGDVLQIPLNRGELDGVFCVEVLEHALLPQRAVEEICRVVRPGGRILILDKNVACQPLSQHEPWERWFAADEVADWLARQCEQVRVAPVPQRGGRGRPLFWCWTATRRND